MPSLVAERFGFRFELDAINDIQPWGEPGRASLHWFGLTSGRYWIETPVGEVLRYTPEIRRLWNFPFLYVDYLVARLFEDLQEHLPAALEPVPEDVAAIATPRAWVNQLDSWIGEECSDVEGRHRWDLFEAAMSWWWHRQLDTAYLSHGPRISLWRVDDVIHFRWVTRVNKVRGVPVFVVPDGEITLSLGIFRSAAFGFCDDVLLTMRHRIEGIRREGWSRADCAVDLTGLIAEQKQREETLELVKHQEARTDWQEVRVHLDELRCQVGSPSLRP